MPSKSLEMSVSSTELLGRLKMNIRDKMCLGRIKESRRLLFKLQEHCMEGGDIIMHFNKAHST